GAPRLDRAALPARSGGPAPGPGRDRIGAARQVLPARRDARPRPCRRAHARAADRHLDAPSCDPEPFALRRRRSRTLRRLGRPCPARRPRLTPRTRGSRNRNQARHGCPARRRGGRSSSMDTMLALRKLGREPGLTLVEVPVPAPGKDEVLVAVEAASVCGTDLHIERWDAWAQRRISPPLTLGHEFAGTVVEVGADVRHVAVGDYVSAESHVTCGVCFHCRTGHAHMCERTRILGVDRDGAFARYVVITETVIWQNDRAKLPPEIAALQEPFGNAVFATSGQELTGRSVAVLGCGPIGLFAIGIARASGAALVLAADRSAFRLDLAGRMGASAVVDVD